MQKILNQTEILAFDYLKKFGFENNEIEPLIHKGEIELENELNKLNCLMNGKVVSLENLNNLLHAIKGLLSHLGHIELVQKLDNIRTYDNVDKKIKALHHIIEFSK